MKYPLSVCLFLFIESVASASNRLIQCMDTTSIKAEETGLKSAQDKVKMVSNETFEQQQGGGYYTAAAKDTYDFSHNQPSQQALAEKTSVT